jgi:predicted transcriptional regulator
MSSNNPKRDLYVQFAAVAKAIANEHRLELLELIAQGERSVEVLAGRSGLSIANASQHLQHLRRAGLVKARRQVLCADPDYVQVESRIRCKVQSVDRVDNDILR